MLCSVAEIKKEGVEDVGDILCFENPVLRTVSQKEALALSCFLCLTTFGRKTNPPVSRVVVYLTREDGFKNYVF